MNRPENKDAQRAAAPVAVIDPENLSVPKISIHMFCVSEGVHAMAQHAFADRRMARATTLLLDGSIPAAIERYRTDLAPDLIVIETGDDREETLAALDRLADLCPPATRLILIGARNDVDFYRELISRGVSDYLLDRQEPIMLIRVIARLYASHNDGKVGRVLAFIGASGGAGSSSVAQNVAATLASEQEAHTILLDLDLAFGSASLNMNIQNAQGAQQALQAGERLDDVFLERLLVPRSRNFSVLVSPVSLAGDAAPAEAAFLRLVDVAASLAPFLVIDLPRQWTSAARRLAHLADECVVVAEPTLLSLRNAKMLMESIAEQRANDTPPHYVISKKGLRQRRELDAGTFEQTLSQAAIASIDHQPAIFSRAENEGSLVADALPRSQAAESFRSIAWALSGRPVRRRQSIFSRVKRVFHR